MSDTAPIFELPGGLIRALGRDTDANIRFWDQIISRTAVAPRMFAGQTPQKSPDIRRFYHASFLSQRGRGYCVGFNTCGTMMTRLRIPQGATATTGTPLPLVQLSPLYTYDIARWQCTESGFNMGSGDGLISSEAFKGSKARGCVELQSYPSGPKDIDNHKNGTKPNQTALTEGKEHLMEEFAIADSFEHGLELMAGGFPLAFGSMIPSGMMKTDEKGFFRMKGSVIGGHCYQMLDYDKDKNLAWIAQAWERWGEKTSDPHFQEMHGFTQLGTCPLDELAGWFSDRSMAKGESEILVCNTVAGFDSPIEVDYSSM